LKLTGKYQFLVYADDVNILGGSLHTVRETAEPLIVTSKEIGLEVYADKCKYMAMSRDHNVGQNHSVNVDNSSFERVEEFKYLGINLTNEISLQEEIKSRLKLGNACYHLVQYFSIPVCYGKIVQNLILPVVLYECAIWSLTLREVRRLRLFENSVLRRIFVTKRSEETGERGKLHNEELNDL